MSADVWERIPLNSTLTPGRRIRLVIEDEAGDGWDGQYPNKFAWSETAAVALHAQPEPQASPVKTADNSAHIPCPVCPECGARQLGLLDAAAERDALADRLDEDYLCPTIRALDGAES